MSTLDRWTPPLPDLDTFERRVRRMFQDLGVAPAVTPPADVYETEQEVVVELEVPGFDEKELAVSVSDHTLTVTGSRRKREAKTEKTLRVRERLDASFERRFQLPPDVDADHVAATYGKGVLTLHVPKLGKTKRKLVKIERS